MATAAEIQESQRLIEQQAAARRRADAAAIALAVSSTRSFDQWYSTAAITTWAARLVAGIELIQRNLARQTDVYLSRQATLITGRPVRPVGIVDVSQLRKGVTHAGAYGRVADQYRYQQALLNAQLEVAQAAVEAARERAEERVRAKAERSALDAALARARAVAELDMQLAVRAQAQKFMVAQPSAPAELQPEPQAEAKPTGEPEQQPDPEAQPAPGRPRLIGYRRMIHPELSKSGQSCGMCIVASTRMYYKADLMAIHEGCNCLPLPIYEGNDPGGFINDDELQRFYDAAGGNQARELKNTRYQIDEHGEIGPVLSRYGKPIKSAEDVKRDER